MKHIVFSFQTAKEYRKEINITGEKIKTAVGSEKRELIKYRHRLEKELFLLEVSQ